MNNKKPKILWISASRILLFIRCPRAYWYQYLAKPKPPKLTSLARVFGSSIHDWAELMENPDKAPSDRRFYYKTLESAGGGWSYRFNYLLQRESEALGQIDDKELEEYRKLGFICVAQYWKLAHDKPKPIAVERKLDHLWKPGIGLTGKIDQIREWTLPQIARFNPGIIVNGQLHSDYDPNVIVDLKTNRLSYEPSHFIQYPTLMDWVKKQYELHFGYQAAVYIWLYKQIYSKWPTGFLWVHVRSGKTFFTPTKKRQIHELFVMMEHLVGNLDVQSFPMFPGKCNWCDFLDPCHGAEPQRVSYPSTGLGDGAMVELKTGNVPRKAKQMRLGIRVPKQKQEPLIHVPVVGRPFVFGGEPFDLE